ncbi:CCHC-type domain-containing protein [Abeliophyllum distichum]|uniref:CCHC-type domain-containing protein n=1 Tax=Abeliophyllum distichum TaxID=126358 RepID=A0ABD1SYG8_9LAMI
MVEIFLISLPEKFDPLVAVIEETKDLEKLEVEELMGSLKLYEQRFNRHSEKSIESAFQSNFNVGTKNERRQYGGKSMNRCGRSSRGRGRNPRGRGRRNFERRFNEGE